jgi:hypothetical protein
MWHISQTVKFLESSVAHLIITRFMNWRIPVTRNFFRIISALNF